AVAHGTAGEHCRTDVVTDRITREAGQRRNAIGNFAAADGPQGEPIVESEREVSARDKKSCSRDIMRVGCLKRRYHLVGVDVAEHMKEDDGGDRNNRNAQNQANPIPTNRILKKSRHRAQRLEHYSSGSAPATSP